MKQIRCTECRLLKYRAGFYTSEWKCDKPICRICHEKIAIKQKISTSILNPKVIEKVVTKTIVVKEYISPPINNSLLYAYYDLILKFELYKAGQIYKNYDEYPTLRKRYRPRRKGIDREIKRLQKLSISIKLQRGCEICQENKDWIPSQLHFHHIDPTIKIFSIGQLKTYPEISEEILLLEIAKCLVVCANCHAGIHNGNKG